MAKRYSKPYDSNLSTPSKRPKLDISITASQEASRSNKPPSTSRNQVENYDLWGDDFNEDEMKEIEFATSQTIKEDSPVSVSNGRKIPNVKPQLQKSPTYTYSNSKPSTSRSNAIVSDSDLKKYEFKAPSNLNNLGKDFGRINNARNSPAKDVGGWVSSQRHAPPSQTISSSDTRREIYNGERSILFDEFKDNLINVGNHNSTFQSQLINKRKNASNGIIKNVPTSNDTINVADDSILRKLDTLQLANEKLMRDCMTKDGETSYLRGQLQQTIKSADRDKIDKTQQIQEQANQHRIEINLAIKKEKSLQTQLELQTLELNKLNERCKLLESGAIKLTQPHTAQLDSSNKNRLNTTLYRSSSIVKTVQVIESGAQTASFNVRNAYRLRKSVEIYPLCVIPQSIFEPSQVEPSVVEIQVIERVGTKNLPILQDEENIRIFENPDLVKPIVTIINNQKLNVEFCAPDVAALMKKTAVEINSYNMLPVINKLVAVARELLLNTTLVLQRISGVIKNDDIRDMNDVYFSDFYKIHVDSTRSICDSNAWHDRERGIEARRSLAILSHIATVSNYLSQYIAGKISLNFYNDSNYESYIKDMNSYNKWPKKGSEFEMLELVLEFVSTVGYVRRSHQFTGLIIAITKLLISVKERLVEDKRAIDYVFKILKEIIFSRPLLLCHTYITKLFMTFSQSVQFCKKLCVGTIKNAIAVWKDELHFTSDACIMQIYMAQLEFYQPDSVEIVDITYALVCFALNLILLNDIPWISQPGSVCKCSSKLFGLTLSFLYKCSKVNLDEPVQRQNYDYMTSFKDPRHEFHLSNDTSQAVVQNIKTDSTKISPKSELLDKDFILRSKHKQLLAIRKGIMFLCYLSTRDPDFIIRLTETADSFNLFMQQIKSFDNLKLDETEQAALSSVKLTLFFDEVTSSEEQSDGAERFSGLNIRSKSREKPSGSNRQQSVKLYIESTSGNQQTSNPSCLRELVSKKKSIRKF